MTPVAWKKVRLGDAIVDAQAGFASGARSSDGVAQLRMNNVTDRGTFDWSSVLRVPADSQTIASYSLRRGDVLFNNTNSTALVGKSAFFTEYEEPIVYSNHFTRIRTDSSRLMPEFLALWLRFQWRQRLFENICNRWIGQSAVQRDKLLALEMDLPPIDDQRRIAAYVQEQSERIEKARAPAATQLEAARALPAAYLREVFEGPEARKWSHKSLGSVCALGPDNGIFKRRHDFGQGVPVVNVSDLYRDFAIEFSLLERVRVSPSELERYSVASGDLFFCRSSLKREGIGRCCLAIDVPEPSVFECHVMRIRLDPSLLDPAFVGHYMSSPRVREAIIGNSRTATMTTMNQEDLASIEVPVPPLGDQLRIVASLTASCRRSTETQQAIEERTLALDQASAAFLREAMCQTRSK